MTESDSHAEAADSRLVALARDYLAELEAGRTPDRQSYLKQAPEHAAELADYLDGVELAYAVGPGRSRRLVEPSVTAGPGEGSPRPVASKSTAEFPLEPLGDFRILREIGRGGMGTVYEAIQLSLGRRVALKVLPFAAALDAKHLQRFRTESHAAAQLHHTNIVPVYAVGCERGTHFYAMQLIEGRSLAEYLEELRSVISLGGEKAGYHPATSEVASPEPQSASGGTGGTGGTTTARNRATLRTIPPTGGSLATAAARQHRYRHVARMIQQIAQALDYAHEAGVIHRDIKPANLLLDSKGNVWITDFGLAQVAAEPGQTRTGDIFGTLRYMSPEQASGRRGEVDHRTDIYSLGVTLYELLALRPMFDGSDHRKLLDTILNREPPALRQCDRQIPIELETIVLKATAKLPSERYATAGAFAGDLERFLADRPILARRPTWFDVGRKWLRRHPSAVVVVLLGLTISWFGVVIATLLIADEQQRTAEALKREQQRAQEAEAHLKLARRSVDDMIRIAEEDLLAEPAQQTARRKMLEASLVYYQEFLRLKENDPGTREELVRVQERVQGILADLALLQGAYRHWLLRVPLIQDDLRLSEAQKEALAELLKVWSAPRRDRPPTRQEFLDELRTHEAEVLRWLTPQQDQRLRQIGLQLRGISAFREPEVTAALDLSPVQTERLKQSLAQPGRPFRPEGGGLKFGPPGIGPGPGGGPERGERGDRDRGGRLSSGSPFSARIWAAQTDAVQALIQELQFTAEQKKQWEKLVGPPLQLPPESAGPLP